MAASDMAFDGYGVDDDTSPGVAPMHFLELEGTNPEDLVVEQDWRDDASQKLGVALSDLDERSRDIVQARWLSEDKTTLHVLADKYAVSAERIRQIEKNAIKKLKTAFAVEAA
jgi:RNA polymerase sigma-32 factor